MSQHAERERAIRQARKLMEMTRSAGASEAEANMAMKRLSEIMEVFNLNSDEIVLENMEYIQGEIVAKSAKGDPMSLMLVRIGQFCDVKVWMEQGRRTYGENVRPNIYRFFGTEANNEMFKYLYDVIDNSLRYEEKKFQESSYYREAKCHRRKLTNSFRQGFIHRVNSRLVELIEEQQRHEKEQSSTGNSLVLCRESIRERKFQEQIGVRLVSKGGGSRTVSDYSAYDHGKMSANNVSFGRPVEHNNSSTLLIGN